MINSVVGREGFMEDIGFIWALENGEIFVTFYFDIIL